MTAQELKDLTARALTRMNEIYGCPVFDEWALVVATRGQGQVLHYDGPRSEAFAAAFPKDMVELNRQIEGRNYFTGEFEFTTDGHGTMFDAFIKVSDSAFLVCNNTRIAMSRIRGNTQWLKAQVPFAGLCARISESPLEAVEPTATT